MDNKMKWLFYIDNLIPRTRKLIYLFYRFSKILKRKDLLPIYHALFALVATHGIIDWGNLPTYHMQGIEIVQNRLVRIIFDRGRYISTSEIFKQNAFLNMRFFYKLRQQFINKDTSLRNYKLKPRKV